MLKLMCLLVTLNSGMVIVCLDTDRSYSVGNHGYNSLIDVSRFLPSFSPFEWNSSFFGSFGKSNDAERQDNGALIKDSSQAKLENVTSNNTRGPVKFVESNGTKNRWNIRVHHEGSDYLEGFQVPRYRVPAFVERSKRLMNGVVKTLRGGKWLNRTHQDQVSGRFLNLFEVVNFNNVDCLSSSGVKGTCLHSFECSANLGVDMGPCAQGFGVCCAFLYTCGQQTSANCSTFTNPGFPQPSEERLSCTLAIQKTHVLVSQLRLDFLRMELQPPTNGTCVDDQFVITGQNVNSIVPILCGINNGQHMYVDVSETSGPFYVSVLSAIRTTRLFQIEICQIVAGTENLAPPGCLQYHKDSSGILETFNYQTQASVSTYRAPGYFNNLNYAICIRRASGKCTVTYSTSDLDGDGNYEFQILNFDAGGIPLIPPEQAGAEIFNCPDDFIVMNGIRLCGERLNDATLIEDFTQDAPVTELSTGPIVLNFRTNGNVTGRGFHLFYKQNPCASSKSK